MTETTNDRDEKMTNALATTNQTALLTTGETASTAVAALAKASIEARWMVATHQPRNLETVRAELLLECKRPSFAKMAMYLKPIGGGISGLSIRFVEAAICCMGNIDVEAATIYDDDDKRIVEVRVTDFQKNICQRKQITIEKTVERKKLRRGQEAIKTRTNSYGDTIFVVEASEDDFLNKEGALTSKAIRTCGLRIIPGWLQDEAERQIRETSTNEAARDPDSEKRKILDGFGQLGITPENLEEYLGHPIAQIVPGEVVELQAIWKTVRDGEATWVDVLAHRLEMRGEEAQAEKATTKTKPVNKGTTAVMDALNKKKASQAKAPVATPAPAPQPAPEEKAPAPEEKAPAPEEKPTPEKPKEKPATKRPSRSKAARDERKAELVAVMEQITDKAAANLYVQHGDPRNKEKALAPVEEEESAEPSPEETQRAQELADEERMLAEERAAADAKAKQEEAAKAEERNPFSETNESGEKFNPETGEVLDEEEPEWMREGGDDSPPPPDGEGF